MADAVAVSQVVAGYDPDDPVTAAVKGQADSRLSASLVRGGLKGARIGVLRQAYEGPTVDPEVRAVFAEALDDLRRAGATVLDTVIIRRARIRFGARARRLQSVQVRDQSLARRAGRSRAGEDDRLDRALGEVPSVDPGAARGGRARRAAAGLGAGLPARVSAFATGSARPSRARWIACSSTHSSIRRGAIRRG